MADHIRIQSDNRFMTQISPEELWALTGDDAVEEFRGSDHEINDFDRKQARDMELSRRRSRTPPS
jgi:hypothetical protein